MEDEDNAGRMRTKEMTNIFFPGIEEGFNFKCQVPYIATDPTEIGRMVLMVDGIQAGSLFLLEDVNQVATETFKLREEPLYAKTIIRTVVKGIAAKMAKEGMDRAASESGLGLAGALLSVAPATTRDRSGSAISRLNPENINWPSSTIPSPESCYIRMNWANARWTARA